MSLLAEQRSHSAVFKRAEQLKRWLDSDTNNQDPGGSKRPPKIQFSQGCVFLAACSAADREEVKRLLAQGADIDTPNVDGLTALHQACIDDNLHMVEFLVEHGADVNRGDNEGWTPLHATASCGFVSIAEYLIENGANVAAVNNDGELPIDIAELEAMEELLQQELDRRGIDAEAARNEEETTMLTDARTWLNAGHVPEERHPKTGATALHVAAAKGYIKVMNLLIQSGVDLNAQDFDGWTALHASAHWGQQEACEMLVEHMADMEIKNYSGQSVFDVSDSELVSFLEELKKKQHSMKKEQKQKQDEIVERRVSLPSKRRISDEQSRLPSLIDNDRSSVTRMSVDDRKNVMTKDRYQERAVTDSTKLLQSQDIISSSPSEESSGENENSEVERRNKANKALQESTFNKEKIIEGVGAPVPSLTTVPTASPLPVIPDVPVENDTVSQTTKRPASPPRPAAVPDIASNDTQRKHDKDDDDVLEEINPQQLRRRRLPPEEPELKAQTSQAEVPTSTENGTTTTATTNGTTAPVRRSFVPPVRDEGSEAQRKAHAKRVRETRRSTQGVTLEDMKSAEELVRKQQQQQSTPTTTTTVTTTAAPTVTTAVATTAPPSLVTKVTEMNSSPHGVERSSSWRLRQRPKPLDSIIDTSPLIEVPSLPPTRTSNLSPHVWASTTLINSDREVESRTGPAAATQAAIQRRRRPKRRSTGVVHPFDLEDGGDSEPTSDTQVNAKPSEQQPPSTDRNYRTSRYTGSTTSLTDSSRPSSRASSISTQDEDLDYKKLYEDQKEENERLRDKLKKIEQELEDAKSRDLQNNPRSFSSDVEKRERRALERKLSEMEEELKLMQKLKAENEKLRAENKALTRVVSKLTTK